VNNPAEKEEPQHSGEDELKDGFDQRARYCLPTLTTGGPTSLTTCGTDFKYR
jgi:hypothetical protein